VTLRYVYSEDPADLAEVFEPDVELVSITRPASSRLREAVADLFARRVIIAEQWVQPAAGESEVRSRLAAAAGTTEVAELVEEIDRAVAGLARLLGVGAVGVRIVSLRGPMCPRFHVDRIPCRLLATYGGAGTEWIPEPRVDPARLVRGPDGEYPVRTGQSHEALDAGSWSLLKGGCWDESFRGVVHRSPQSKEPRLLVSLDPMN